MGNFFGHYERNIDEKCRLPLPPKLVGKDLPAAFYALKGLDGCLSVYPREDFDRELDRLRRADYADPKKRAYVRLALDSALELLIDGRGRLVIPRDVARAHGLSGVVVILGTLDHFELWSQESYEKYLSAYASGYEDLATSLGVKEN